MALRAHAEARGIRRQIQSRIRGGALRKGHRALLALSASLAALAGLASTATAAAPTVTRLTYLTPHVSPGGTLTVKAVGPKGARCSVTLIPAGGSHVHLGPRHLSSGHATWRYRLSPQASLGFWLAVLNCSSGDLSRTFNVALPVVAPARIKVIKSGFVSEPSAVPGSTFLYCGIELRNVSRTDARDLTVRVSFADTQGSSIATSTNGVSLIPAGQTFYLGCLQQTNVSLTVGAVEVSVKVGQSTKHSGTLPIVSNLALTPDGSGTQTLTGRLTDRTKAALSQNATIYALYYDAVGNLLGSDSTMTGASVEPGASVGFSFPYAPAAATTARVSVDPCGSFEATIGVCKLP